MMRTKKKCVNCGEYLSKDEVAVSKKMLGRYLTEFFCIDCLANILECDLNDLEIKVLEFKEQGCTLFL